MKTSEVLNKAADLIEQRGHSHGRYIDIDGAVCALGAVRVACGAPVVPKYVGVGYMLDMSAVDADVNGMMTARRALLCYLNEHADDYDPVFDSIPKWNDRNDAETVINALRSAALTAEDNDN